MFSPLISVCLCFLSLPWAFCLPTSSIPDPSTDFFYQPPSGFETRSPGTILRQREINPAFFGLIPDPVDAYQLLYRTTAINGSAIAAVTSVFVPSRPMNDRFISFHTAYDSASVLCNPSYQYQSGVAPTDGISNLEFLVLQRHLLQGYIVAAPDHEGPDAALGAGRLAGMMVLDGIRAVINFGSALGFSNYTPAIVGEGYSGGAIATGWAAALQASYAPELNIKGWAQGGTPSNLTGTFLFLDNTTFSGFIPAAIDGLNKPSAYGSSLQPILDQVITSKGQELLDYANTHCVPADLLHFPNDSMLSPEVQTLGPDLLEEPTIQSILNDNLLDGSEIPMAPMLVYHSIEDEIIPYSYIPALVDSWCSNDVSIQFISYESGGHVTGYVAGLGDTADFIESAFAGSLESGCSSDTK